MALESSLFAEGQNYRDPAGRFSVLVPQGWTVAPQGEMVLLRSGNAYTLIREIQGGGADPHQVARFTDDFGKDWQSYRRMKTGFRPMAGTEGAYAIYTGVNGRGVDAIVKAVSVPMGSSAIVILSYCPVQDWPSMRASVEDVIEAKFTIGPGSHATATPRYPADIPSGGAPNSRRRLPDGFSIKAVNGNTGQALTATFSAESPGRPSARRVFSGIFPMVASYFDSKPNILSAIADAADTQVQAFFRASWNGAAVRGMMVLALENGSGFAGIVFDREDLAASSLAGLTRQISGTFGGETGGPRGGGSPAVRPQPLSQTSLPDGSGAIGLAQGWRISNSYKGTVDVLGPSGELMSLGGYNVVFVNPLPGTPATQPTGPYRNPAAALALHYDVTTQRSISRGQMNLRVIEQTPAAAQGGEAAYILYEVTSQTHAYRGLAMVWTKPVDQSQWMYYYSMVTTPAQSFAQTLPTMWAMWKSWSINPAVFRERMDRAIESMRETSSIIHNVYANQQRTYDNTNTAWSQAIRGVTTIEDMAGQRRWNLDTGFAQDAVNRLNEQGYQFRVVPLPELVQ